MNQRKQYCIVVMRVEDGKFAKICENVTEAASWLVSTGVADCRGHQTTEKTAYANISRCIKQPKIYDQFYGFKWYRVKKSVLEGITK